MKRIVNAFLLVLSLLFLNGCIVPRQMISAEATYESMGTILTITAYAENEGTAKNAIAAAHQEIERINGLMSVWDSNSPLSILNRTAASHPVTTDAETFALIKTALKYSDLTGGMYDITAGPLIRLWGFFSQNKDAPPSADEIEETLNAVGYEKISLNETELTVFFKTSGMEIDLGSIAKGYAVGRAIAAMKEAGAKSALLNLGGNIGTIGLHPTNKQWVIGIRDPRKRQGLLGSITLSERFDGWSLASSGQYERYYVFGDTHYGHIIDPTSGYPVDGLFGTTILSKSATTADVVSTATFVASLAEAKILLDREPDTLGLFFGRDQTTGEDTLFISHELEPYFSLTAETKDVKVVAF